MENIFKLGAFTEFKQKQKKRETERENKRVCFSQKSCSCDFWKMATSVLMAVRLLPCPLNRTNLFTKNFSTNSNLDDLGISFLHNIHVTPRLVKKVITNLDYTKKSDPNCVLEVVLHNCETERLYVPAELFNVWLNKPCFPDCWKNSWKVHVFKNVRERSTTKNFERILISNF